MIFTYGKGMFRQDAVELEGEIILSEHKLYLRGPGGDLTQTYVPLEKIERLVKKGTVLQVHVRPSLTYRYVAVFEGHRKSIADLIKDLVQFRGLKKKFMKNEWEEEAS